MQERFVRHRRERQTALVENFSFLIFLRGACDQARIRLGEAATHEDECNGDLWLFKDYFSWLSSPFEWLTGGGFVTAVGRIQMAFQLVRLANAMGVPTR